MFSAALLGLVCTAETTGQARGTEPVWDVAHHASAMECVSYSDHSALYARGRFLFRLIYFGIVFCCIPYVA